MHRRLARLSVSALFALALACVLAPMAHAAEKVQPRIVNGDNADITDYPYQVALYNPQRDPDLFNSQFCGGVIVDATHVITAAHCLFDFPAHPGQVSDPSEVEVLAGATNLSDFDTGDPVENIAAAKLSFDPGYDPQTGDHDVGVIELSARLWPDGEPDPPIDGSSAIAPIPTIDDGDFGTRLANAGTSPGTMTTVSGWGYEKPLDPNDDPQDDGFPDHLQAVDVPLIDTNTCQSDFSSAPYITQITGLTLFCAGDDADPTNLHNKDSCSGDSGGPLVIDPNQDSDHSDVELAGLVDSGFGCAWNKLPGIYTRISDPSIQDFLMSDPPAAPSQVGTVTITGGNQPGQTLICDASNSWSDPAAHLTYSFATTVGAPLGDGNTYTIQQKDQGSSIQCEVKAQNDGGYGFGLSSAVFIPFPATPPAPPPAQKDTTAPKLRVRSKRCTKTTCTVKVKVTDSGFSTGISKVSARLNYARLVPCRKHGKRTKCKKRAHKTLRASRGKGNIFTIVARHLKPGTSYSLSLVPIDKAGNKPRFSTITNIRTQRRHRHH